MVNGSSVAIDFHGSTGKVEIVLKQLNQEKNIHVRISLKANSLFLCCLLTAAE